MLEDGPCLLHGLWVALTSAVSAQSPIKNLIPSKLKPPNRRFPCPLTCPLTCFSGAPSHSAWQPVRLWASRVVAARASCPPAGGLANCEVAAAVWRLHGCRGFARWSGPVDAHGTAFASQSEVVGAILFEDSPFCGVPAP